jgi:putative ABC transport system permease protein
MVNRMAPLDRKLFRHFRDVWSQALAIALVLAAGVATVILGNGAYRSLDETRSAYYERYRFADLFATAKRFPQRLVDQIAQIDGIAVVEGRIQNYAILDIEGFEQPATGQIISLPAFGRPKLNALVIKAGRYPEPGRNEEVIVNESFAKAHGFQPGSYFQALLNGRKKRLIIVGVALTPEYIYALGPGDLLPDDHRFGIIWMGRRAAEAAFDLDGAFNAITARLDRNANQGDVISAIDGILDRYGGTGAYGRDDHLSHAFIDAELNQLRTMSRIVPPIFFAVAAFLINMALERLITREREQIGLLKAIGYSSTAIAVHYLKFVSVITAVGVPVGFGAGIWLGRGMTNLYAEFFHFPFLVFLNPPDVFAIATIASFAATWAGALHAVRKAIVLSPAVAMSPPAPPHYGRKLYALSRISTLLSSAANMVLRHTLQFPVRAGLTVLGIAASGGLLIMSLSTSDSIDFMIDVTFFRLQRQDVTVSFHDLKPLRVRHELARLPGVRKVELHRYASAILRNGQWSKRRAVQGLSPAPDLHRLLDLDLKPVALPDIGIALSEKLAQILHVGRGDFVTIEMTQGKRRTFDVPVTAILQGYIGLQAVMRLDELNRQAGEGNVATSADLMVDGARFGKLYRQLKDMPSVSAVLLQKSSLGMFRKTLARNINIMMTTFIALAVIIAFGVVYNSARIQLSERGRELASLRVLGFTRAEVSRILLGEIALLTAFAIPLSWLLGYGFTWMLMTGFETELYRVPFVIARHTYVYSSLIMVAATVVAALVVRLRIDQLDLIKVLKTRE